MKPLKTTQQYQETIEQSKGVVAVLFTQFKDYCDRCVKAKIALQQFTAKVPVYEFSSPQDAYPLNELQINNVPTMVIFKNGKEKARLSGISPELYLKEFKSMLHNNY